MSALPPPRIRSALRGITPYLAPADRGRYRRLDANEGPPLPDGLLRDLLVEAAPRLAYYPEYSELRRQAAAHFGLSTESILPVCGADEGIRLVIQAFAGPGDRVATVRPTFGMYAFYTRLAGSKLEAARLAPDFDLDRKALGRAADGAVLVVLASPNNPTGRPVGQDALAGLLERAPERPLLLDETYAEFSGQNFIPWIERYPNLVILRTLSKTRGVPGLRCGFVLGAPPLVAELDTLRSPYNLTATAACVGAALLARDTEVWNRLAAAVAARVDLQIRLASSGVPVWPSVTHFTLAHLGGAAENAACELARRGILIRTLGDDLAGFIRISVTGPDDTAACLAALAPWLAARRYDPIPAPWRHP
jgi:histidinol-phosphate aminotransferase